LASDAKLRLSPAHAIGQPTDLQAPPYLKMTARLPYARDKGMSGPRYAVPDSDRAMGDWRRPERAERAQHPTFAAAAVHRDQGAADPLGTVFTEGMPCGSVPPRAARALGVNYERELASR